MAIPDSWEHVLRAPCFVINLARRPDKWTQAEQNIRAAGFTDVRRVEGVDGYNAQELARGWHEVGNPPFDEIDTAFSVFPGRQGCFLSHVKVWQKILDENLEYAVVFEDDVIFHPDWAKLAPLYFAQTPPTYDVIYMGFQFDDGKDGDRKDIVRTSVYCTHATLITRAGAKKLLENTLDTERVFTIDCMTIEMQRRILRVGNFAYFNWYCWNGESFPTDAREASGSIPRSQGLVFQHYASGSDIDTNPVRVSGLKTWEQFLSTPCFVINLDRRPDRWSLAKQRLRQAGFTNVRRISGVDGQDPEALRQGWEELGNPAFLPQDKDFALRPGKQGCFLSHVKTWKQIRDEQLPYALIFEDDIVFHPQWEQLGRTYFEATPKEYDAVFLGAQFTSITQTPIVKVPVVCLHALLVTNSGVDYFYRVFTSGGVCTLDIMMYHIMRKTLEKNNDQYFQWYCWNDRMFRPEGAMYSRNVYDAGLVYQDQQLGSDIEISADS